MQRCTVLLLALFIVPAATSSASAESAAQAWLKSHKSPTDDQLGELQQSNPAAFALVNSLLSKHAKHMASLTPEERNGDVFRKMMTPRHLSLSVPRIALPAASSEVQAQYNPAAAADRDESSVDKLLSAVASMGGDKGKKIALLRQARRKTQAKDDNALLNDANLFGDAAPVTSPPVQAVVETQKLPVDAPHKPRKNSYLEGLDLSGDMPVVQGRAGTKHKSEGADLTSFSWDDAVSSALATPAPKKVVAPKPAQPPVFLKWLGLVKKAPAPSVEAEVKPTQPKQNSYIANFMQ